MKPPFELTPAEAIEDMLAGSDAVVVGQVDAVETSLVPFEGGFVHQRRAYLSIERVIKGDVRQRRISFEPGMLSDMTRTPLSFWQENRAAVVVFLVDLDQRKIEQKKPNSAARSWTHSWCLNGRVPGYGVPIQNATPDLIARLTSLRASHSVNALAHEADIVVLGAWTRENGKPQVAVQRVLKGSIGARFLPTYKGFGVFPESPALYFLRQRGASVEIIHCSAGVKPVRGRRLRQDGLSIDEAIAQIEASVR